MAPNNEDDEREKVGDDDEQKKKAVRPGAKQFDTALTLMILGGLLGLHHLYLKRTRQAVLYACTFGLCGVGLIYDIFQLETYVSEANFDEQFVERLKDNNARRQKSAFEVGVRCSAEMIFGSVLGLVAFFALPVDWQETSKASLAEYILVRVNSLLISPLATAFGVWFVAGIGSQRVSLSAAICGALITAPVLIYIGNVSGLFYTALMADFWANYSSRTNRSLAKQFDEQETPYYQHIALFAMLTTAFWIICITAAVNNAEISNDIGKIPLRDFIWKAVSVPDFWQNVDDFFLALRSGSFLQAFSVAQSGGNTVSDAVILSSLLNLDPSTITMTDIKNYCRQLVNRKVDVERFVASTGEKKTLAMLATCEQLLRRINAAKEVGEKSSSSTTKNGPKAAEPVMMKYEL